MMKRLGLVGAVVVAATAASPAYCEVIKVGVIGTMSGPFALFGQNFKEGIDTWVAEHGSKVGDHQIEFIYRDEESPNPAKSKALAQELIVKDKVQYLAGFYKHFDFAFHTDPYLKRAEARKMFVFFICLTSLFY